MPLLRARKGLAAGTVFPLYTHPQGHVLGRQGSADLAVEDPRVSRRHAMMRLEQGRWTLEDLGSSNGTLVGGRRIERVSLEDGSIFQVGGTLWSFHPAELPGPPELEAHGTVPREVLREECGALKLLAHQGAMDRDVRLDLIAFPPGASPRLQAALEAAAAASARPSSHSSRISAIAAVGQSPETGCAHVVFRRAPLETLEAVFPKVLELPLGARIALWRDLVELVLARWKGGAPQAPLHPGHIELDRGGGGSLTPILAGVELSALAALESQGIRHLPAYSPYLPPELVPQEGSPGTWGVAASAYNLGALGYHLITGQRACGEGSLEELEERHRSARQAPARLLEPDVPAQLSELLDALLEKSPERRPCDPGEILASIPEPARGGEAAVSPPLRPAERPPEAEPPRAAAASAAPASPRRSAPPRKPGSDPASPAAAAERSPPASRASRALPSRSRALPLWLVVWVALFLAARHVTRILLEKLGE